MEFDDYFKNEPTALIIEDQKENVLWTLRSDSKNEIRLPKMSFAKKGNPISIRGKDYVIWEVGVGITTEGFTIRIMVE